MKTEQCERRGALRHALQLPISVLGTEGETVDLSAAGVRFVADAPFESGAVIAFTVVMNASELRLACTGRVTRVEPLAHRCVVAATIDEIHFQHVH